MSISGKTMQAASGALHQRFREVRAHSLALAAPLSKNNYGKYLQRLLVEKVY